MKELDDIAKEAADEIAYSTEKTWRTLVIRAAIDKALEVVLRKEPSIIMRQSALEACRRAQDLNVIPPVRVGYEYHAADIIYRAMTKQLLEELKGNSSVTRAGNHPSAEAE